MNERKTIETLINPDEQEVLFVFMDGGERCGELCWMDEGTPNSMCHCTLNGLHDSVVGKSFRKPEGPELFMVRRIEKLYQQYLGRKHESEV